jgi:hypothetical protein
LEYWKNGIAGEGGRAKEYWVEAKVDRIEKYLPR